MPTTGYLAVRCVSEVKAKPQMPARLGLSDRSPSGTGLACTVQPAGRSVARNATDSAALWGSVAAAGSAAASRDASAFAGSGSDLPDDVPAADDVVPADDDPPSLPQPASRRTATSSTTRRGLTAATVTA